MNALLPTIAVWRPQRLDAPREEELSDMLDQIGACLAAWTRAA